MILLPGKLTLMKIATAICCLVAILSCLIYFTSSNVNDKNPEKDVTVLSTIVSTTKPTFITSIFENYNNVIG